MKEFPRTGPAKDAFKETITVTIGTWDNKTPSMSFETRMDAIFQSRDLVQHMVMLDLALDFSNADKTLTITIPSTDSDDDYLNRSSIASLYDTLVEQLKPE